MFSEFEGKEVEILFTSYNIFMVYSGKVITSDEKTTVISASRMGQLKGLPSMIGEKYNGEKTTINNRYIISVREINE